MGEKGDMPVSRVSENSKAVKPQMSKITIYLKPEEAYALKILAGLANKAVSELIVGLVHTCLDGNAEAIERAKEAAKAITV